MDQRKAIPVVYVAALLMSIMDVTIVNVALPTIGREFRAAPGSVDVIIIGYLVSLAVFIPASGWIGDRFGGKQALLTAIGIFTTSSALCAVSTNVSQMVIFRVLQGVGGGMLTPVGLAMLYRTYPPSDRVRVAAMLMVPTSIAPAFGPLIGGVLVETFSWRWVFLINVPIGLLAIVFGLLFVESHREPDPGRFDFPGFVLAGVGLSSLMYGISEGPSRGWSDPLIVGGLAGGLALLGLMIRVEQRRKGPMVDLSQFRNRSFRSSVLIVIQLNISFFGTLYLVPLYLQDGRGISAFSSGLTSFTEAIGVAVGAQLVSRTLYPRFGPRRLMVGGFAGMAVATGLMAIGGADTSLWWMRSLLFVLGIMVAHVTISVQATAFATVSPASTGRASTLFTANRQVGSAVGVALLSTVLVAFGPTRDVGGEVVANLGAYHAAFLASAGIAVLGAVLAFFTVDDEAAAVTRTPRSPHSRTRRDALRR